MFNKISANLVNLGYVSILSSQNRRVLKILFKLSLFLAVKNARKTSTSFSNALIMISLSNSGLLVSVWKLLKKKLLAEIGVFIKGVVNCSLISLDKLESWLVFVEFVRRKCFAAVLMLLSPSVNFHLDQILPIQFLRETTFKTEAA